MYTHYAKKYDCNKFYTLEFIHISSFTKELRKKNENVSFQFTSNNNNAFGSVCTEKSFLSLVNINNIFIVITRFR